MSNTQECQAFARRALSLVMTLGMAAVVVALVVLVRGSEVQTPLALSLALLVLAAGRHALTRKASTRES